MYLIRDIISDTLASPAKHLRHFGSRNSLFCIYFQLTNDYNRDDKKQNIPDLLEPLATEESLYREPIEEPNSVAVFPELFEQAPLAEEIDTIYDDPLVEIAGDRYERPVLQNVRAFAGPLLEESDQNLGIYENPLLEEPAPTYNELALSEPEPEEEELEDLLELIRYHRIDPNYISRYRRYDPDIYDYFKWYPYDVYYLTESQWRCRASTILVNVGWGNGLLPDGI